MLDSLTLAIATFLEEGDIYILLVPIYVLLLGGERVAHHLMRRGAWNNHDSVVNLFLTGLVLLINVAVGHLLPLALMVTIYSWTGPQAWSEGALGWIVAWLLYDLAWYTDHRIAHRVGFFWAMHHVHHSSTEYNMTVASRGFLVDTTLLSRPTFYLLPLAGVAPEQFLVITIITNIWGIAQHTRLVGKLGWLEWWLATPSNHRVHHGYNPKYIDRNYGEVLMIWDQLFGTYQAEEEEPKYGVVKPIETYHPGKVQLAGFQWLWGKVSRCTRSRDKLACLFMPPEWEPAA